MQRSRFIGGIIMLVLAASIFAVPDIQAPEPVAITLLVVGVALVATARRRAR